MLNRQIFSLQHNASWSITGILHHFFWRLALHFSGDVLDVIPPPLLVGLDELVEVPLVPNGETLKSKRALAKT